MSGSPPLLLKLEAFLPHRITLLGPKLEQAVVEAPGQRRVTPAEWRVVITLGEFGTLNGRQISARANLHKSNVTRTVGKLMTQGLVAPGPESADDREIPLQLTKKGQALYDRLAANALDFEKRMLEHFSEEERAALDRALEKAAVFVAPLTSPPAKPPAGV